MVISSLKGVDKDKLKAREAAVKESKKRIKEKKEREAKEKKDRLLRYRDMADKVEDYFYEVTDEQLEADLKRARFDFYKLIKMSILPEEE